MSGATACGEGPQGQTAPGPPHTHTPHRAEPSAGQSLTSSFWMESGERLMCCTYFLMSPTI